MPENNSSEKFLYRAASHLLQRFGNDLKDVAIVFNNRRPQLFLKKYLAEISGKPLWSPQFYTIQQFFSKATDFIPASPLKQFFILFAEYNALLKKEGKEPVVADSFYPLAEIILSDFSEIDYAIANPDKVFNLIGNIAELHQQFPNFDEEQLQFMTSFWSSFSEKRQNEMQQKFIDLWRRMPGLYQNFHKKLMEQGLVTYARMYRNLAEKSDPENAFIKTFKHTVFIGFNALSKAEEKLFKAWQDEGYCSFYFDSDTHYMDDKLQEAGYFIRRNINTIGLINQLENLDNRIDDPEKQITIVQALGNISQGKILSEILSVSQDGKPDQKAIILADESLLLPVLQTVKDESLNVTMGYPFGQSSVYGLCDLWLTIQEDISENNRTKIPYRHVLSFLFNPLIDLEPSQRNRLHTDIISKRISEVDATDLWPLGKAAALTFTPTGKGAETVEILRTLLLWVSENNKDVRWMEKLLIAESIKSLTILFDNLKEFDEENKAHIRSKFLFRIIRMALQGLTVPFEGEPLSGLQVMGILESRCLDFDELIIIGMNEGVLPKISKTLSFIPDNIRRAFGLPVLENQNSISAYFFYRLLHCAKKVTLIYNGITDESSNGEESRFIKQLRFETACSFTEKLQQNQAVQIGSEKSIVVEKNGMVWSKLQQYFSSKGEAMDKKISASGFTDYISCPLKFFFGKIAGLKEPEDLPDQIEANMIGSVLHRLMQTIYADAKGKTVSAEYIREKEKILPKLCLEALSNELYKNSGNNILHPNALQQIVLKVIAQYAINILRHDESLVPFTIKDLENKSDYKLHFEVAVGAYTQKVWLYGIIDRVDLCHGKTRIIDYKTGKDKIKFRDFDSLFDQDGKNQNKALLQTLFYTYIYEKVNGATYVEPRLYTVRTFKEDTLFKGKGGIQLEDQNLEEYKQYFENKLREKINELFDASVPFIQTNNLDTCKYCPYKDICQR